MRMKKTEAVMYRKREIAGGKETWENKACIDKLM